MGSANLKLISQPFEGHSTGVRKSIQRSSFPKFLTSHGWVDPGDLIKAQVISNRCDASLGEILLANNMLTEEKLFAAYSTFWNVRVADLEKHRPDPRLMSGLQAQYCLRHAIVPWRQLAGNTFVATSDPEQFQRHTNEFPRDFGKVQMVLAPRHSIQAQIDAMTNAQLSRSANSDCPAKFSARSGLKAKPAGAVILALLLVIFGAAYAPRAAIWAIVIWVSIYLFSTSALRLSALFMHLTSKTKTIPDDRRTLTKRSDFKLPKVSVLVPLFQEAEILPNLISNLKNSDYPKEILEVLLVLESGDIKTRRALSGIELPNWIRCVTVPPSALKTKPRAMNYALSYCSGDVIGIYDAEDAPEFDQIYRIVKHLHLAGPRTACVQGYLDFYNPNQNWMSRCFTIEYAIWFRVILPGIRKLNLPVPLGGTTVFFRRSVLEEIGAWDAYNVTEDADLGMRLARLGYECDFVATTTFEEANCFVRPWIKQRSRWLKGFAMTWLTHMRRPKELLGNLGLLGFLTFQIILFGTLSNFILAPSFWLLWWVAFGGSLPFTDLLSPIVWHGLAISFVASEIILLVLGVTAMARPGYRSMIPWVATMVFYWPLGTIAVYKALYELVRSPFYWDKTKHGHSRQNQKTRRRLRRAKP